MTHIDYLILAVIVISAGIGAFRGLIREAIALATWIIGIWLAWNHNEFVVPYLGGALAQEPVRSWAARIIVLVLVLLVGTAIGALSNSVVRTSIFSGFDRLLGFGFGLLRGLLILGLLGLLGQQLRLNHEPWWISARLMPYVQSLAGTLRAAVGDRLPQVARNLPADQGEL